MRLFLQLSDALRQSCGFFSHPIFPCFWSETSHVPLSPPSPHTIRGGNIFSVGQGTRQFYVRLIRSAYHSTCSGRLNLVYFWIWTRITVLFRVPFLPKASSRSLSRYWNVYFFRCPLLAKDWPEPPANRLNGPVFQHAFQLKAGLRAPLEGAAGSFQRQSSQLPFPPVDH